LVSLKFCAVAFEILNCTMTITSYNRLSLHTYTHSYNYLLRLYFRNLRITKRENSVIQHAILRL
jgi:hypothetical protein